MGIASAGEDAAVQLDHLEVGGSRCSRVGADSHNPSPSVAEDVRITAGKKSGQWAWLHLSQHLELIPE